MRFVSLGLGGAEPKLTNRDDTSVPDADVTEVSMIRVGHLVVVTTLFLSSNQMR